MTKALVNGYAIRESNYFKNGQYVTRYYVARPNGPLMPKGYKDRNEAVKHANNLPTLHAFSNWQAHTFWLTEEEARQRTDLV